MAQRYYRALLEPAPDGRYGVHIPDFPGTVSAGENAGDAIRMGEAALATVVEAMTETGRPLPEPSAPEAPLPEWLDSEAARHWVRVMLPAEAPGKTVRINVTFDESMLSRIDKAASRHGMSRSAFLAEASRRMIAAE